MSRSDVSVSFGVQQQQRKQRARLAPRERERAALVEDLERAEDAEVHCNRGREPAPGENTVLLPPRGRADTGWSA